ncbi:MAG: glycosyltransferase family 4 protein [Kiritimatiellaeota bacterium]|nr:glycosyltransferase family 4 protein [Kiritimatiellota bacterium]
MGNKIELYEKMIGKINSAEIADWSDIAKFLTEREATARSTFPDDASFKESLRSGIAFLTFDYGIDGVSIEIAKYATCFERILSDADGSIPELHFIGGDFHDKAEAVLKDRWKRFRIEGINGWSKWYDGKWFSKLYYEDMPEGSDASKTMAREMWRQTAVFAEKLGGCIAENEIELLFPVNLFSNPGNFAITLAGILVSELMGIRVFNSNHDFYWEGGAPASERKDGEKGPRDHFFKNMDNKPFFSLFQSMYPWNGANWAQVNINTQQSEALNAEYEFPKEKLFELSTSISDEFFAEYTFDDIILTRKTMGLILSDGAETITPVPVESHLANLADWMSDQKPVVCGARPGLTLDPANPKLIYCLQPTRVVARKRIEMDLTLIEKLLQSSALRGEFENDSDRALLLHVTGPVPIEHQADLETVLNAYSHLIKNVPAEIAERVFIAFSVGTEDHPSLAPAGFERLRIEDIYRLATVILFPSETEGRGLPIIESAASGIPIVCSRYYPEDVFAEVVGEELEPEKRIIYTLFPDNGYPQSFLDEVAELTLAGNANLERVAHNKKAVAARYGTGVLVGTFEKVLETLR